jgi:molybdate transport system regulatory protein
MTETLHKQIAGLGENDLVALRAHIDRALGSRGGDGGLTDRSQACRLFSVSDGVRRLDRHQLAVLAKSFKQWMNDARDARTRRSRERVVIVFLMLRYTGARLGEVLALDERKHIDFFRGLVRIPDGPAPDGAREIPLPAELIDRIRQYCVRYDDVTAVGRAGEPLFDLDQGFLRKKFHEQEERSGLPKELLNPRVLRNSRAIELLQGGMPMRAVQALLGHSKMDFTSSYVDLTEDDLRHIIQQHFNKEFGVETSARNTFAGEIIHVASNPVMCEVTLKTASGNEVVSVITNQSREKLGLAEGRPVTAIVKAPWVILEKATSPAPTSARNAFPGTIADVISDDVVAEVSGTLDDGTPVCALVTTESFRKLGIGKGDKFIFMFKAMSVILI